MIAWLWNIIVGQFCFHKWKQINQVRLWIWNDDKYPYGHKYVLQCEKCGNIKTKKT